VLEALSDATLVFDLDGLVLAVFGGSAGTDKRVAHPIAFELCQGLRGPSCARRPCVPPSGAHIKGNVCATRATLSTIGGFAAPKFRSGFTLSPPGKLSRG
jgi:hypothetical protein